jgi:hypothetical protein
MKFLSKCVFAGAILFWAVFIGCSKKEIEAPIPAVIEQAAVPTNAPASQATPSAQVVNVQQVNANWDAISKDIAAQNYDNAVRAWVAMDQAQRQAQLTEAVRQEYARRAYQMQDALRQKAETDPKALEAYRALGRVKMGR